MSTAIDTTETLPLSKDKWAQSMEALTEEQGYFQPVGPNHSALFIDESPTLLVTFESTDDVLASPEQMPRGYEVAKEHGWSMLTLFADVPSWFRDPAVYAFFDRQVDDAFFEDFDSVLFFGAGFAGHAACAYSVAAPGAQVLALNPRATLAPAIAGWDSRDRARRRLDFRSRFGYAPDMLDGAGKAIVVHDPRIAVEAMHATLFRAPHVRTLNAPFMGENLVQPFADMGILHPMIEAAMAGHLTPLRYAQLLRKRRDYAPYLAALLGQANAMGRPKLQIAICQSAVTRLNSGRFAKRLAKLQEFIANQPQ